MIWFICPKCGLKDSSWDGIRYCGECEEVYQKEMYEEFGEAMKLPW